MFTTITHKLVPNSSQSFYAQIQHGCKISSLLEVGIARAEKIIYDQ
jgi:hypothetical protein